MKNQNIQFEMTTPPLRIVGSVLSVLLMSLAALRPVRKQLRSLTRRATRSTRTGTRHRRFSTSSSRRSRSDTLTLTVDVAGSLDALPNPPGSGGAFDWHFALNTDDSTDPPGLPLPPAAAAPAEFYVGALWNGTAFSGLLIRSAASAIGPAGLAVLDSGQHLGIAHHYHRARGAGCADTGSGCAARRDLELLDAQG